MRILPVVALVLAPCALLAAAAPSASSSVSAPSAAALQGVSARQALHLANIWRDRGGLKSFVTDRAVNFTFAGGRQVSVPLPAGEMVLAVAPYLKTTHPCKTHYMSGCQGELVNVPVAVRVTGASGKVVLQKTMRTLPNGFLELWLPRGQSYRVHLSAGGKSAQATLKTGAGADTCITTMKLE